MSVGSLRKNLFQDDVPLVEVLLKHAQVAVVDTAVAVGIAEQGGLHLTDSAAGVAVGVVVIVVAVIVIVPGGVAATGFIAIVPLPSVCRH